jgi:hypothetical protein
MVAWAARANWNVGAVMKRVAILAVLPLLLLSSLAHADETDQYMAVRLSVMAFIAGTKSHCPKVHLDFEAMAEMLRQARLISADTEKGGKYYDLALTQMTLSAKQLANDPTEFCRGTTSVFDSRNANMYLLKPN